VSQQQRDALDRLLRDAPLGLGGDVAEQRVIFEEMMAAIPMAADVTTPRVPHVFQGFAAMLDEADAALNSVGEFLRAHLGG
jgi:hypothetical protein